MTMCCNHAERRLEDLAARKHFEVSVQGDRLANPSSTNPGMAAGRVRASGVGGNSSSRARGSIHLKAPPLKLQLPLISTGVARSSAADQHMHLLLLSPMQMTLSEEMKKWASDNKLLQDHAVLPPLMKPYLRLPFDQLTLWVWLFYYLKHVLRWSLAGALERVFAVLLFFPAVICFRLSRSLCHSPLAVSCEFPDASACVIPCLGLSGGSGRALSSVFRS